MLSKSFKKGGVTHKKVCELLQIFQRTADFLYILVKKQGEEIQIYGAQTFQGRIYRLNLKENLKDSFWQEIWNSGNTLDTVENLFPTDSGIGFISAGTGRLLYVSKVSVFEKFTVSWYNNKNPARTATARRAITERRIPLE